MLIFAQKTKSAIVSNLFINQMNNTLNPEKWVENYANMMVGYALKILKSQEEAYDMVQDTFLSALKNKESFLGNSSEKTWLFRILQNKILDFLRKKNVQKVDKNIDVSELFFEKTDNYRNGHWIKAHSPKTWTKEADDSFENKEIYQILYNCIAKLPEKQANLVQKKFLEENSSEIVCKDLNISTSNFWALTHRAKLFLRACLEKNRATF